MFNVNVFFMKPAIKIKPAEEVKVNLAPEHQYKEERQVLVRAYITEFMPVRIWPSTYLICNQTGTRLKMLFSENVSKAPHWGLIAPYERFYMIFEGLPKACLSFDLYEEIDQPGNFHIKNIGRNGSDVYDLEII